MIKSRIRPAGLLVLLTVAAATASPALAQDAAQSAPEVTPEHLEHFARAHIAVSTARDEFHGQVARVHDAEGRTRAREEVETKIRAILEEHELTREDFDALTLRISLDGALRARFEELLSTLSGPGD
jgi:BMFP domain-containing protein YqiC